MTLSVVQSSYYSLLS